MNYILHIKYINFLSIKFFKKIYKIQKENSYPAKKNICVILNKFIASLDKLERERYNVRETRDPRVFKIKLPNYTKCP